MTTIYRLLAVNVLPQDLAMYHGQTAATLRQTLTDRLDHVKSYWEEASLGELTITPQIHPTVLTLPKNMAAYRVRPRPRMVDGTGVTGTVTFTGIETLQIAGPAGFQVNVTFPAATLPLHAPGNQASVAREINDAITAAWTGTVDPPIVAGRSDIGQLRIRTREFVAPGTTLDVTGGTAAALLGLDAANRQILDGSLKTGGNLNQAVVDTVKLLTAGMTESAARSYINNFYGIVINFCTNYGWYLLRARAERGPVDFDIFGKPNTSLAAIYITPHYAEDVFAHEFGHNQGFQDLYEEGSRKVGAEVGSWDIMANNGTAHPGAWIKSHDSSPDDPTKLWVKDVKDLDRPTAGSSNSVEVLLVPLETPIPSPNPYATSHPGVAVCHAVRVPLTSSGGHAYYIENRQRGPWNDPTLGSITHNRSIRGSGLVATEATDIVTGDRCPVTLVQPYELDLSEGALGLIRQPGESDADWNERVRRERDRRVHDFYPLDAVGDEITLYRFPNGLDSIHTKVTEVVGTQVPHVLKVKVDWGRQGTSFDLEIRDWRPPPWESVDIWVDNDLDNGWDEYRNSDATLNPHVPGNPVLNGDRSKVGIKNRLYARVWNHGDIAQTNVRVDFEQVKPAAMGPTAGVRLGTDWVDIAAGGSALAMIEWTPRKANDGHVCLRAVAEYRGTDLTTGVIGELNQNNNAAQENITDWFLEGASPFRPVTFDYVVINPLTERAEIRMQARGLPRGVDLHVRPFQFVLEPGERVVGQATLMADSSVPYGDEFDEPLPVVTLEAMVQQGCTWTAFGGVSGVVNTVRRADVTASLDPAGGGAAHVSIEARSHAVPIRDAHVRVSLWQGDRELTVERTTTDTAGGAHVFLEPPAPVRAGTQLEVRVDLSPTRGTGPGEAVVPFVV
jgi:hypothetical protein